GASGNVHAHAIERPDDLAQPHAVARRDLPRTFDLLLVKSSNVLDSFTQSCEHAFVNAVSRTMQRLFINAQLFRSQLNTVKPHGVLDQRFVTTASDIVDNRSNSLHQLRIECDGTRLQTRQQTITFFLIDDANQAGSPPFSAARNA